MTDNAHPDTVSRVDAALAAVTAARRELQAALEVPGVGARADKRFINTSLVATFERLADAEQALRAVRAEMEAERAL